MSNRTMFVGLKCLHVEISYKLKKLFTCEFHIHSDEILMNN